MTTKNLIQFKKSFEHLYCEHFPREYNYVLGL